MSKEPTKTAEDNIQKQLNTPGLEVVHRAPDREVLVIGCQDAEVVKAVKEQFNEKFQVQILNKKLFNSTLDGVLRSHMKWQEDQKVLEYTKNPENIQQALVVGQKIIDKVGEEWFFVDDLVDDTNFSFKQARTTLDLMFAFGFAAQDVSGKKERWLMIANPERKMRYINDVVKESELELDKLKDIQKFLAKECGDMSKDIKKGKAKVAKSTKPKAIKKKKS